MYRWLGGTFVLVLLLAACTRPVADLQVTAFSPEADAVDVAVDATVSATFNQAVDENTLDGSFELVPAAGGPAVAGALTYDAASRTAVFTPTANLAYATEYTASLAGTVATASGVVLEDAAEWSFTTEADPDPDAVAGVTVAPATATLSIGEDVQLTADVSIASGSPSTAVTWSTDDDTVATVDAAGLVTAVGAGTATITAASVFDASFSGDAEITVIESDVIDGVSVSPSSAAIAVAAELQLTADVSVVSGTPSTDVTWGTDDDTVATVDATGLVTAVGPGAATITVTSVFDGTFFGEAEITVAEPLEVTGDYAPYAGDANVNDGISLAFPTLTGGLAPFTFEIVAGALPSDFVTQDLPDRDLVSETYSVELDAATGEIAGATGFPGLFTGTVQVTDAAGQTASADFELDLEIAFRYVELDFVTTADTFPYDWVTPGPNFIVAGNRVQVSGVLDTFALPEGFIDGFLFTLTYVDSNGTPTLEEQGYFVINVGQGAITQIDAVPGITQWIYNVDVDHAPSAKSVAQQVRFFDVSDPFID